MNIKNSHSDVKGGTNTRDGEVQNPEREVEKQSEVKTGEPHNGQPNDAANPTVEETDEGTHDKTAEDRAKGMTEEQFEAYNTALRLVSKAATAGLTDQRYNAFEDGEIKRIVKQQVIVGSREQRPQIDMK